MAKHIHVHLPLKKKDRVSKYPDRDADHEDERRIDEIEKQIGVQERLLYALQKKQIAIPESALRRLRELKKELDREKAKGRDCKQRDESEQTKAMNRGKLSQKAEAMASNHVEHRENTPESVFLEPEEKKYPVKVKKDGKFEYDRGLLLAAARRARINGNESLAKKADEIREREFGSK